MEDAMRRLSAGAAALAALVAVAGLAAACGGNGNGGNENAPKIGETQTAVAATTPGQSTSATVVAGTATAVTTQTTDATAAVDEFDSYVAQLQQRDRDRLRDLTGDQLRQRIRDQDLDRLASCVPAGATVTVVSRSVQVSGDTATVTATLKLTLADGTSSEAQHVVTFVRQADGTWKLSEIPSCPFP
jgi:hypothetical protein